ncbi:PREDICTED: THUMP domain-containing protein 2-like [Elephantulus edwardii]|uniref:THUMP domain-containing protein 2-like n=1 Tax=Elephantulus edwardii TaxID=28737 RepID=UPI0003F0B3AF|nr:PREDICTED: THUMP domain-containing protein 2-like [Elephantulus edwardii]
MSEVPAVSGRLGQGSEPGLGASLAGGTRFFCTAGRGLEPFLMREVQARLGATQVEYVSGKVFFTTFSDLNILKKLKSAERLFLLIKKQCPLNVSSANKGRLFSEMRSLVNDDPGIWLNGLSIWKSLLELDAKDRKLMQENSNPLKRKVEKNDIIIAKSLKIEQMQDIHENRHSHLEETLDQDLITKREHFQDEFQNAAKKALVDHNDVVTFRVSCRCSGSVGKAFTSQEIERVIGVALMKQLGWKADLRKPNLEVFVHLNDVYSLVGIPVFRVPLASRTYIRTAGLRSTVAWAMASLAEIKAGTFVLDPMCGLGTILLEAANEWPDVYYMGADVSDSQLLGACDNLQAAGLNDKIELLKVSAVELPLASESVDIIISDIPFGKKFKLEKDIRSILQEMERVLRVGGTAVLLLSEDHHRQLRGRGGSDHTSGPGVEKGSNPEGNSDTAEESTLAFQAGNQEGLDKMAPFGSLVPVECYKVSLGKTDAFISKYRKSSAVTAVDPLQVHTS